MKGISRPIDIFNTVSKCLKEYDKNLKNTKVMFVIENKDRTLSKEEVYFPRSSYKHLTGVSIIEKSTGKSLNAYEFYDILKDERLNLKEYIIKEKDSTTDLKLQVLPQLMRIDRMANMFGEFSNFNIFLQTEKIAGNINACMGFIKDNESNTYIPNTSLKKDIRNITNNRNKIVAIFKKDITEKLYKNITYLKQSYQITDILKNKEISKTIDTKNIYSADRNTDKKIYDFIYKTKKDDSE